jgi:hypothetical protein
MRVPRARLLLGLVAGGLLVFAAWALDYGIRLLRIDDPDGVGQALGLIAVPSALVIGIVGLGVLALAIRR